MFYEKTSIQANMTYPKIVKKEKKVIDYLPSMLVCYNWWEPWYFNDRRSIGPRGVRSRDRKNDSCWGSNGSSGRNRLTPNRPSFVCAINRLVLTTSCRDKGRSLYVIPVARARPSPSARINILGTTSRHPTENWFPSPHPATTRYLCKCGPVLCE